MFGRNNLFMDVDHIPAGVRPHRCSKSRRGRTWRPRRPCQRLSHRAETARACSTAEDEPVLIDWRELRDGDGSGGPNEDTPRTKG